MKLNSNMLKIALAVIVMVATLFWAVDSVRPRAYSGANLEIEIGTGPVTVTNTSDEPVLVQLVGPGARIFTVVSPIEGVTGTSTRQGAGGGATQLREFNVPSGQSEFTVTRGSNVSFVSSSDAQLAVSVLPGDSGQSSTTYIVAGVVILGLLYYISSMTGHGWLNTFRFRVTPSPADATTVREGDGGQGPAMRAYGDNRVDTSG